MGRAQTILEMIKAEAIPMDELEEALEEASHGERMMVLRELTPGLQRGLFEAAEGRAVDIDQIVPPAAGGLEEVIHEGQNTLPAFRAFQKRFCRPEGGGARLWGYNHQTFAGLTGPGYFVAYDDEDAGEVCIDYRELPPERPSSWPEVVDNKARLGRFVYHGMVDRLRRVSEHVTIGRAYKKKPMRAWFTLVRVD